MAQSGRSFERCQFKKNPVSLAANYVLGQAARRSLSPLVSIAVDDRSFVGGKIPFFGRSSNGGFWSGKIENAISFNGD
jgi:hypothetical protein